MRSIFSTNERISTALKKFVLQLISPAIEAIGWDFKPDEDYLTGQLRALLISTAGSVEHPATVKTATERFASLRDGNNAAVHPNLRLAIFRIAVQTGGRDAYDFVKETFLSTTSGETRELCLAAMGRVQDPALVREFLMFHFSDAVAMQDKHVGSTSLALNAKARPVLWEWLQANWTMVSGTLSGNTVAMDRYVRVTLKHMTTRQALEEMEMFFKDKDTTTFERSLPQIYDAVRGNAAYLERDEALLVEYLQAHGYA